jgi:hypothetical protein
MAIFLGFQIPDGYELIFILTLVILVVKLTLVIYLGFKLNKKRASENKFATGFLRSVLIMMLCWFFSRLFYAYFDFFLTGFNDTLYHVFPNVWYWKVGSFLSALGIAVVLFTVDRKILQFKFKGIFAYVLLAAAIIQIVYPTSTPSDFDLISTIGVIGSLAAFMIPIFFFYIGAKTGMKKIAWTIAFGTIVYTIGSSLVGETFIGVFLSVGLTKDVIYLLHASLKALGLIMITYGGTHFSV